MNKTAIIIKREFNERVRKKSFILTTILTPLLFVGLMAAPIIISKIRSGEVKNIIVIDNNGAVGDKLASTRTINYTLSHDDFETVKSSKINHGEELDGILVIPEDIDSPDVRALLYTFGSATLDTEIAIGTQLRQIIEEAKLERYEIENISNILEDIKTDVFLSTYTISETGKEKPSSGSLSMILAYFFGFLIYMFVFIYGAMVMQGVIEEKSSKVLEVIVCSVKPFQLMMGKIIGIAAVAITQFLIWVAVIIIAGKLIAQFAMSGIDMETISSMSDMSGGLGGLNVASLDPSGFITDTFYLFKLAGCFLLYFIGGYLLYAAMFAAIGSAVDNTADSQQLQLPVTIPMILAILVMVYVMREPSSSLAVWFSMIPFTSPIIMMARIPYGVPGWEIGLSLAILFGTFLLIVWLAGKIYRVGIFMYGKKTSFRDLYKWIKQTN